MDINYIYLYFFRLYFKSNFNSAININTLVIESEATYGVGKSLPGGEYKANVVAECIAD